MIGFAFMWPDQIFDITLGVAKMNNGNSDMAV